MIGGGCKLCCPVYKGAKKGVFWGVSEGAGEGCFLSLLSYVLLLGVLSFSPLVGESILSGLEWAVVALGRVVGAMNRVVVGWWRAVMVAA